MRAFSCVNVGNVDVSNALLLIVGAVLLGVIVVLLVVILRQRKLPRVAVPLMATVPQLDPAANVLFATLSHELRTPLNGLLGMAQVLEEENPSENGAAIEGCARHMLVVLSALVDLTKIQAEQGALPEYREWVNFYDLMEQIRRDIVFRADLRGLTVEMRHQDKSLRLRGDRDHLRAIIENTLLGSIESVSLAEIPDSKQALEISWRSDGTGVQLDIMNPLEQVSENRRQQIEDVFRLTTGENHERIKMEHLYWAVSSALLERYKGVMHATSSEAGGIHTQLSFEMEQMHAPATGRMAAGGLRLEGSGKLTKAMLALPMRISVIVAEDDPITRKLMQKVLERMKQDAVFATNGRDVLELVKQSKQCDLILMDIDMPIMDGMAATLALRAGEAGELGKHVPIVAVTAFSSLSDEGKFRQAGMDGFLPKPLKMNKLRELLLDIIRGERHVEKT